MEIGRSYINENGVALPGSMCRTGWHLEEDEYQEGSKSTDVKHQKKHLCMWQIHTSPDLWRHLWAENPEEIFTTSFIHMPTYGPSNSLCKHIKVQPTVCWSQLVLLARPNCTHTVSLPCSVTLCWYLEFSHGRNLHHGNRQISYKSGLLLWRADFSAHHCPGVPLKLCQW